MRRFLASPLIGSEGDPERNGMRGVRGSRRICWVYIGPRESRRAWHTGCPLSHHISPSPLLFPSTPLPLPHPASPCLTPPHPLHPPTMQQCYLWLFLGCHIGSSEQASPLQSPLSASSFLLSQFRFVDFTQFLISFSGLFLHNFTCLKSFSPSPFRGYSAPALPPIPPAAVGFKKTNWSNRRRTFRRIF